MWSRLNLFKWNVIFFPLEFTHVIFQVSNISHAMWFVSLLFLSHTIIHTLYMERHSHNSSCSSRWPWLRRVCVRQDWARVCACVSVWWSQAWWVGHCRWAAGSEQCHSERCAEAHSRGSSPPPPPIERHHQTFIHTLTLYLSICNTHTIQITDLSSLSHTHTLAQLLCWGVMECFQQDLMSWECHETEWGMCVWPVTPPATTFT